MAILNKIRQKTFILILIIALALFAFILSGIFSNTDVLFGKSPNTVATINGKDISRGAFMAQVEARQNPNASQSQIMNQVYEGEVRKAVMEAQYDKLGLQVGREQMRDLLAERYATAPQFLNADGVYDASLMNQYIKDLKENNPQYYQRWIAGEREIAASALQQNYINLVRGASTATLAEGELAYKLESDKVDIKYVQVPYTSIKNADVSVSDAEVKSYIAKNPKKYQVEASRNFQYVQFKEVASKEDEAAIKSGLSGLINTKSVYNEVTKGTDKVAGFADVSIEKAEAFVNENTDAAVKFQDKYVYASAFPASVKENITGLNTGAVFGPYKDGLTYKVSKLLGKRQLADSIKSSHIIVPFVGATRAGANITKTKEEAKKTVDSLFRLVRNDKKKYAEVANAVNTDGTKGKDGSIGWIRLSTYNPASFDPAFADFLFFNKKGAIDVVLSKFGYHIIRVDEKKNVDTAYKVATIERKIEPSVETEDAIFRNASNFEVNVAGKDFQEVAKAAGLAANPVNTVKVLDENIPGVGSQREVVRWAFKEGADVGDVERFKTKDGYIIVQLTQKNEAGLMNVKDASVTATPEIRREKKAKLIMDRVSASNLADFAAAEKKTVRTATAINMKNPTIAGAGKEAKVVGVAFGLKAGQNSGLIAGDKGVYMVETTKFTPATKLENYQSFANQVSSKKSSAINTRLYNALKAAADIEDNRANTVQ